MKASKKIVIVMIVAASILFLSLLGNIVETNMAGQFQIKQAAISGEMSVRFEPGMYWQIV